MGPLLRLRRRARCPSRCRQCVTELRPGAVAGYAWTVPPSRVTAAAQHQGVTPMTRHVAPSSSPSLTAAAAALLIGCSRRQPPRPSPSAPRRRVRTGHARHADRRHRGHLPPVHLPRGRLGRPRRLRRRDHRGRRRQARPRGRCSKRRSGTRSSRGSTPAASTSSPTRCRSTPSARRSTSSASRTRSRPGVIVVKEDDDSISSFDDLDGKTTAQSLTSNWYTLAQEQRRDGRGRRRLGAGRRAARAGSRRRDDQRQPHLPRLREDERSDRPEDRRRDRRPGPATRSPSRKDKTALVDRRSTRRSPSCARTARWPKISEKYFGVDVSQ